MMGAHLMRWLHTTLLVAQMVVQLAAVRFLGRARAANDQEFEGSGIRWPRFASMKSEHFNVRGGPNKDQTWRGSIPDPHDGGDYGGI